MTFAGPDSVVAKFGRFALFLGRLVGGVPFVLRRPRLWIEQIHMSGALSLVITMLSGLFVGMVLGLQGYDLLRRFGSTESLGTAAALGLLRELGPVITALLFAGRAGTAITSEIGLMLATDQLAAMEMMAVDPVQRVLAPRFWGGVLSMPLLAALFSAMGIYGSYVIGVQLIGINNRNLATFETDLATTEQLTERYGAQIRAKGCLLVSESGLFSRDDLDRVQSAGADAVLVGESLMRQSDVTTALETRTVDTHILNVRKKLRDDAAEPRFIETLHGIGYKFVASEF